MFDFDFSKLLLIGVVALIFIPPKDLPAAMRTVGQLIGKARRMAAEFQGQFNEAIREAELDDLKDEFGKLKQSASLESSMAHVRDVASAMTATAPIAAASAAASLETEKMAASAAASLEKSPAASAAASLETEKSAAPAAATLEELRAIQAAESLESSVVKASASVDPLPAAVAVETRHVAEAGLDTIMGPPAPTEAETLARKPVAAPVPPEA